MEEKEPTLGDIASKLNSILEGLEEQTMFGHFKSLLNKTSKSVLVFILIFLLSILGSVWHFFQPSLQAEITDGIHNIHEVPVLQSRIEHIEDSVKIMRDEHGEFRKTLRDQSTVLQQILKNTRK